MAGSFTRRLVRTGLCVLAGSALAAACSQGTPETASAASPAAALAPAAPAVAKLIPAAAPAQRPFTIESVLQPNAPIGAGDYVWNSDGAPAGPILIAVDLGAQRLYAYRGGVEIGRSSILYGADDKPTPLGTYPILQKKRHHISNLYGAPMPYMMRLTTDGVAIHGSEVEDGSATHGCIGIPDEFAALLFAEAKVGDRVIVAQEWMRHVYYPKRTSGETA
jgi:lipoprotein-anchoring transpeptidase ErfK/SrfK